MSTKTNINKTINYIKKNGLKSTFFEVAERLTRKRECYIPHHASDDELKAQRRESGLFDYKPLISVVVPMYKTEKRYLEALIYSVAGQSYENWELILVDGSGDAGELGKFVRSLPVPGEKIRYADLGGNFGISGNSNRGIDLACGEYTALVDHDDLLERDAFFEIVKGLNRVIKSKKEEQTDPYKQLPEVIYTDEDRCGECNCRFFNPIRKPDYNPEYLLSNNYICHLVVMKTELIKRLRFREEFNGAQDHDLLLRAAAEKRGFLHIPKILYHWRVFAGSTSGNTAAKLYAYEAGKKAAAEAISAILPTDVKVSAYRTKHVGVYGFDFEEDPMVMPPISGYSEIKNYAECSKESIRDSAIESAKAKIGALGGLVVKGAPEGRILSGPFKGMSAAAGGEGNRRFIMQECDELDIRNICLCKEAYPIFKRIVGVPYEDFPLSFKADLSAGDEVKFKKIHAWERIFDYETLPKDTDFKKLGSDLSKALKDEGYRLIFMPAWETVVK